MPLRHLPVIQNWDCHVCGQCCREYEVAVTDEERQRIEAQGWNEDPDIGDLPRFVRRHWWSFRYKLNMRRDRGCVFLTEDNRCRIHARFGHQAKPLGCRLFPYVMVPAGDHWRVGVRFACPSAAANQGTPVADQLRDLKQLAAECDQRERAGRQVPPPILQGRQQADWSDVQRIVTCLQGILFQREESLERRLRLWLALAGTCRQAKLDTLKGKKLTEFLDVVRGALDDEVPVRPEDVPGPGWIGRVLFRQLAAIYGRKDHGLMRGVAARGRLALLRASWRFALGRGKVPQVNSRIADQSFADLEPPGPPLSAADCDVLDRYYQVKLNSLQFFGPSHFGLSFWDGLEALTLTYPLVRWLARAIAPNCTDGAIVQALSIVDDHFATNPALKKGRYQFAQRLLAGRGEIVRLIAWYGRSA